jgi:hypothetical protein
MNQRRLELVFWVIVFVSWQPEKLVFMAICLILSKRGSSGPKNMIASPAETAPKSEKISF